MGGNSIFGSHRANSNRFRSPRASPDRGSAWGRSRGPKPGSDQILTEILGEMNGVGRVSSYFERGGGAMASSGRGAASLALAVIAAMLIVVTLRDQVCNTQRGKRCSRALMPTRDPCKGCGAPTHPQAHCDQGAAPLSDAPLQGGARRTSELASQSWAQDKLVQEAHAAVSGGGAEGKAALRKFLSAKLEESMRNSEKADRHRTAGLFDLQGSETTAQPETQQQKEKSEAAQDELADCEPFCGAHLQTTTLSSPRQSLRTA